MDKRDYMYIGLIVILIIALLIPYIEIKREEPKKERTEKLLTKCEIWEICDYIPSIWCNEMKCPKEYICLTERRNCEPQTKKNPLIAI